MAGAQKWFENEAESVSLAKAEARSNKNTDVLEDWILGFTNICKDSRFYPPTMKPQNVNRTKRCEQCCSEFDATSSTCPICGHLDRKISEPDNGGGVKCWLRRQCLACQTICYERSCSICGETTTKSDRPIQNKERESLTWQSTSLRVRTPTGGELDLECSRPLSHHPPLGRGETSHGPNASLGGSGRNRQR